MEQEKQESFGDQVKTWVGTKTELVRLGAIEKGASIASGTATQLILFLLLLVVLIFAGMSGAFAIYRVSRNIVLAFSLVTLFYALAAGIYFLSRHKIRENLKDRYIRQMLNHENDSQ